MLLSNVNIFYICIYVFFSYSQTLCWNSELAKTFWFGGQTKIWSETKFSTMLKKFQFYFCTCFDQPNMGEKRWLGLLSHKICYTAQKQKRIHPYGFFKLSLDKLVELLKCMHDCRFHSKKINLSKSWRLEWSTLKVT